MLAFPLQLFPACWFLPLQTSGEGPSVDRRLHRETSSATFVAQRSRKISNFIICSGPQTASQTKTKRGGWKAWNKPWVRIQAPPLRASATGFSSRAEKRLCEQATSSHFTAGPKTLTPACQKNPPPCPGKVLAPSLRRAAPACPIAVRAAACGPGSELALQREPDPLPFPESL